MREIMPRIKPEWVDYILIVDGGSTDGTIEYAKEQGYATYVQKRKGIRHAYIEALPLVKTDCVITFSPDGNSVPEAIPDLIEKIKEGYDMVISSRYLGDAVSHDDDLVTRFGNWLFTTFINLAHKGTYTDAMVIYRIYRKSLFYDLKMDTEESYNMERWFFTTIGIEPLLSVRCAKYKKRYTEIAEDEPKRIGGKQKLQIFRWGAAYLTQIIKERFINISAR